MSNIKQSDKTVSTRNTLFFIRTRTILAEPEEVLILARINLGANLSLNVLIKMVLIK